MASAIPATEARMSQTVISPQAADASVIAPRAAVTVTSLPTATILGCWHCCCWPRHCVEVAAPRIVDGLNTAFGHNIGATHTDQHAMMTTPKRGAPPRQVR